MKSALILIVIGLLCFASAQGAAGAIINGSFEQGPSFSGDSILLYGGSTAITGWQVTGYSIDLLGSVWKASDGVRSLDLSGGNAGGIQQTFATTPGMTYEVSFDLSGNPEGGSTYKTVRVTVGSFTHDYSVDSSGQTRSTLIWHPLSFTFVASGTSATLSFTSLNSGAYGPLLGTALVAGIAVLHFSRRVRAALLPSH